MQGFLNLNKPAGMTSHDCVAKLRRLLKLKRVGHGGTLDPAATGVLPVAIGRATRLLQFLRSDKAYRATVRLGVKTATDDLEGETLSAQATPNLTLAAVQAALPQFQGPLQQIPPAYSAVQVEGRRLYSLARAGTLIEVQPRAVEVFAIEVLDWRPGDFPELDLAIACGPGTYIRAIARDLGEVLGVGGTLAALSRTESCGLTLAESLTFADLEAQLQAGTFEAIAPLSVLQHLPSITLSPELARRWCWGQRVFQPLDQYLFQSVASAEASLAVRIHHEDGRLLGVSQQIQEPEGTLLAPQMVLEPDS
ncbi:tRNA pseudouridine(55) synthase TruB [Trichocoleus sp. FACHB-262]|uniref:tRNA pseudouridine(55) synthase TruB n=1 Tax=Trichocoleus sp. FACHB-262 TaxID=2692869 RepID=UPI0016879B5F|nr:tRNA pseudouridine(55) synthase TruB [Trichocoleus sp. FACHB-262]MBD2123193.1 tRNA pseudouridine(55) synthase TruB [Trichocoleus sp. FACHB-262]